ETRPSTSRNTRRWRRRCSRRSLGPRLRAFLRMEPSHSMNNVLLCVGPERFRSTFMQNWQSNGERVLFVAEERPQAPGSIARLESYCRSAAEVSAVLVLVPKRCSPQKALPGPTIAGLPAGLLPADQPEDLQAWLTARRTKPGCVGAGIMAMWRRS